MAAFSELLHLFHSLSPPPSLEFMQKYLLQCCIYFGVFRLGFCSPSRPSVVVMVVAVSVDVVVLLLLMLALICWVCRKRKINTGRNVCVTKLGLSISQSDRSRKRFSPL